MFLIAMISGITIFGQVGIGTTIPATTLDVSINRDINGNIIDNSKTHGLQAPRLTRAELTSNTAKYSISQKGSMVYITDVSGGDASGQRINVTSPGYYFFDGTVWLRLSISSTTEGSQVTKVLYAAGQPDVNKTVTIGGMVFRINSHSNAFGNPEFALKDPANKTIYVGMNQQYASNGYQYDNFTQVFTTNNNSFRDFSYDHNMNGMALYEFNIMHIVDVDQNAYYRVTFYISGPSTGNKLYLIIAEKF
ncbi:hypothetical protein [Chryseobacterium lactis]|nr:hypothetical protein [Chryseobacterium lactis]